MKPSELNELKRSTKADLIQLIQDQTDNLQAFYEEIEELKSAIAYKNRLAERVEEENKKSEKRNTEYCKGLYREIAELRSVNPKEDCKRPVKIEYFGNLSIVN